MEFWWVELASNWIVVWFVQKFNLGFPQNNCLDLFRQALSQPLCFCTRWSNLNIFVFHPFLDNLFTLNCQNICLLIVFFAIEAFFPEPLAAFFHQDKFHFLISFEMLNLKFYGSQETWLSENSKTCIWKCVFLRVLLISPNERTGFLPPRPRWTFFSSVQAHSVSIFQKKLSALAKLAKKRLSWLFPTFELFFSGFFLVGFPLSKSQTIVLIFQKVIQKNASRLLFCCGGQVLR